MKVALEIAVNQHVQGINQLTLFIPLAKWEGVS
jgi:hypothetical protein